ncbi:MAG: hypothetical protein ACEQSU_14880 [Microgenomates group bacterium]
MAFQRFRGFEGRGAAGLRNRGAFFGVSRRFDGTTASALVADWLFQSALAASLLTAAGATATGSGSVATASITATAGRKAYLALTTNRASNTAPTLSVTGAGQTWALVGSQVTINATYYYELFEATVTTGGSGALTISGTGLDDELAWVVFDILPQAGTTISLSGQDNSSVQTGTSTPSDGIASAGAGNYSLTLLSKGNDPNHSGLTATARSGWSTIGQHSRSTASWGAFIHVQLSPIGGDTTASATVSTAGTHSLTTFALAVSVAGATITGTLAATEPTDTASASLTAAHTASLAASEPVDVAAMVATVGSVVTASLSVTEPTDTAAATITASHTAALAVTEAVDSASMVLSAAHTATMAATEATDTAAFALSASHTATLAVTEPTDTASATITAAHTLSLAATEATDTMAASVNVGNNISVSLAATEPQDTASATVIILASASLAATEPQDVASFAATAQHTAALAATEAPDVAAFTLTARHVLTMTVTEPSDTAAFSASQVQTLSLVIVEAADTASFAAVVGVIVPANLPFAYPGQATSAITTLQPTRATTAVQGTRATTTRRATQATTTLQPTRATR